MEKNSIINNRANTCIIRESWHILSKHYTKKANVVRFDEKVTIKKLPIVKKLIAVDFKDKIILLKVYETV